MAFFEKNMKISFYVYRGLIICLILLGLVLAAGTLYGVFFLRNPHSVEQTVVSQAEDHVFSGIGRLRVATADPEPGVAIIFVSFVFDPGDRIFSEELALRDRDFRGIIVDYIGSFSIAELNIMDEELIKNELLLRFNAILRLGRIDTLFFSDFMIL